MGKTKAGSSAKAGGISGTIGGNKDDPEKRKDCDCAKRQDYLLANARGDDPSALGRVTYGDGSHWSMWPGGTILPIQTGAEGNAVNDL